MSCSQLATRFLLLFQQLEFSIKLLALQGFKTASERLIRMITILSAGSAIVTLLVLEPTRGLFIERIIITIEVQDIDILVAALSWLYILALVDSHGARLILQHLNLLTTRSALLLLAPEVKARLLS